MRLLRRVRQPAERGSQWKNKKMLYLILLFSILFFILAWRRLDWAVMLLIAALPSYLIRFNILGLPMTLLEAMIWSVFIVWFLKSYRHIIENLKLKIKHSFKIKHSKFKIIYCYPFDREIILFLFIALLAVATAGFSAGSLGIWKAYFFEPALLFIVLFNVMKGEKGREKILWALAISALAVSLLAIYQKITGQLIGNTLWAGADTRRVVSFFGYPNAVGLYLGPLLIVFVSWLLSVVSINSKMISLSEKNPKSQAPNFKQIPSTKFQTKTKNLFENWNLEFVWNLSASWRIGVWNLKTIFISLTIILSVLSIYFAKSKGALMGVAAGLIVFGFLTGRKIRLAAVIILVLTGAGLALSQPARHEALKYLSLNDFSGQVRRAQWNETWRMLTDGRVLTGAGLANYQKAVADYHAPGIFIKDYDDPDAQRKLVFNPVYRDAHWQPLEIYLYPHNIILNFWSELGLAGLLLFIWIIIKYFWMGIFNPPTGGQFSMNKFLNIGLVGAMIVIIVHGAVDVPYFKNDLAAMFWLLAAMMSLINLENKYSKSL